MCESKRVSVCIFKTKWAIHSKTVRWNTSKRLCSVTQIRQTASNLTAGVGDREIQTKLHVRNPEFKMLQILAAHRCYRRNQACLLRSFKAFGQEQSPRIYMLFLAYWSIIRSRHVTQQLMQIVTIDRRLRKASDIHCFESALVVGPLARLGYGYELFTTQMQLSNGGVHTA